MNHQRQLLLSAALLALACSLALAPDAYLPMMARAFVPWWALGFGVVGLVLLCKRCWWTGWAAVLSAGLVLLQVRVPSLEAEAAGDAPGLRIAHLNVLQPNTRRGDVLEEIRRADADLVSVQELSPEWAAALHDGLEAAYPHRVVAPRTNCYGIALYSRLPFRNAEVVVLAGTPFIEAEVVAQGSPIRLLIAHAASPGSPAQFRRRNAQLRALAERIAASELPSLLIGDLNTVHWDDAYRMLCAASGLRPLNHPGMATWPAIGPIAFIPLDHALVRGPLRASAVETFNIPGSDHRGLLAELNLSHAP